MVVCKKSFESLVFNVFDADRSIQHVVSKHTDDVFSLEEGPLKLKFSDDF